MRVQLAEDTQHLDDALIKREALSIVLYRECGTVPCAFVPSGFGIIESKARCYDCFTSPVLMRKVRLGFRML